jgi:hypothetical protein
MGSDVSLRHRVFPFDFIVYGHLAPPEPGQTCYENYRSGR